MGKTFKDSAPYRGLSLLDAREQLSATHLFCVGYAWSDTVFGELTGHTVVDACDADSALRSFRSQNRNINRAWIITNEEVPA